MSNPTLGRIVHYHAPDGILAGIIDRENGMAPGVTVFRPSGPKHYDAVPHGAQTGGLSAGDIVNRMVADVYGVLGGYAGARQGMLERQRIGFADAQLLGTQGELEIVGQAQAAHVGVAVGDHP